MTQRQLREVMEPELEEQVEELRLDPAFQSIDEFMAYKIDDEDYDYNYIELQALGRNLTAQRTGRDDVVVAAKVDLDEVKLALHEMGFKFIGRQPIRQGRGFLKGAHGTHPYAGSGAGGSGFGSDFSGPTGTSFGGGPGAIGGGYKWDKNDPRNLGMGSKKK